VKNQPRNAPKLALRKETIRTLKVLELARIAGGQPTTTVLFTHVECDTQLC
jgi:hypothetical protein